MQEQKSQYVMHAFCITPITKTYYEQYQNFNLLDKCKTKINNMAFAKFHILFISLYFYSYPEHI